MLVRNVGHLMSNPAITMSNSAEIPEGIMDAFMTVAGALPILLIAQFADRIDLYCRQNYMVRRSRFCHRDFRSC